MIRRGRTETAARTLAHGRSKTLGLVVWLAYGTLLHLHRLAGWDGRRLAGWCLSVFVLLTVSRLEHSINGPDLLDRWRRMFLQLCDALAAADPEERFLWAGPGMKARMFATARQMETWAHGWEIYDLMAKRRECNDRIKNIATIGVRTFGWTFTNRKLPVPEPQPYIRLQAPSGAIWEWGEKDSPHRVSGDAVEFCQVVTQVRNIADTTLDVSGDNAVAWMAIAQCFAGPPEEPPAPGSRSPQTK